MGIGKRKNKEKRKTGKRQRHEASMIDELIPHLLMSMPRVNIVCLKMTLGDWRHISMVNRTGCFSRGPGFNSQHPHDNTQLSVPGDLTPLLAFTGTSFT